MASPPEKLGSFYLGAIYDPTRSEVTPHPYTYDSRDLTTHAVILGMTGSGKTGLGIILLEEAALDGVPALIIDPKGDMTNLLLTFPDLRPEDFLPWVNPDDARRKGMSVEEYAEYIAEKWREGLSDWGMDGERIKRMRESVEMTVFTPGSTAGLPISVLASLEPPPTDDPELLRERIETTVAALLGLVGIDADPLKGREALLLSNIIHHYWSRGEALTLEGLIKAVQDPPFSRIGVFDLDTFYPERERFELAMALNGLVASPTFQAWLEGEPLDVEKLLYTPDGKPRHSIFYIAHLSDRERMLFVTLLLQQVVAWMRAQEGTTSLRAVLYFDEISGYMPPVREPPAKRLLITLLKQARAFGLGLVLVTQNPVDLDYKGLTNAGTWFIGRLQTERDIQRVAKGLEEAEVGGEELIDMIADLKSRIFAVRNVHDDSPLMFHTRWAMSFLRGPLTRTQIRKLVGSKARPTRRSRKRRIRARARGALDSPPILDPSIRQVFEVAGVPAKLYRPFVLAKVGLEFRDSRLGVDHHEELLLVTDPSREDPWEAAEAFDGEVTESPPEGASFLPLPERANTPKELAKLGKALRDHLYRSRRLRIKLSRRLKVAQRPGESDESFFSRLRQAAREERDREVDEIREKYEEKMERLERKLRRLYDRLERAEESLERAKREEMLKAGEALLSVFLGRRRRSIARVGSKVSRAREKVEDVQEDIRDVMEDLEELKEELEERIAEITEKWERAVKEVEVKEIRPRKRDIVVEELAILWRPVS